MILLCLLFFLLVPPIRSDDDIPKTERCQLRCMAGCVKASSISKCEVDCAAYNSPTLCRDDDEDCWRECRDLGKFRHMDKPSDVHLGEWNGTSVLEWNDVPSATLYAVRFGSRKDNNERTVYTTSNSFENPSLASHSCKPSRVRVASISPDGVSDFTESVEVPAPQPKINPKMKFLKMVYLPEPLVMMDNSMANGTIRAYFEFDDKGWFLGSDDLDIQPFLFLNKCDQPNLSDAIPEPKFEQVPNVNQVTASIGADQMYRKCRYVYAIERVRSRQCKTEYDIGNMVDYIQTLTVGCDNVENSPCVYKEVIPGPLCGQVENFTYKVLNESLNQDDHEANLTVRISFSPLRKTQSEDILYYIAVYGHAERLANDSLPTVDSVIGGVNQTDVIGSETNCMSFTFDGYCSEKPNNTMVITGLHLDVLYGVTICGIRDPRNTTIPPVNVEKMYKMKSSAILIQAPEDDSLSPVAIVFIVLGCVIVAAILLGTLLYARRSNRSKRLTEMKLAQVEREKALYRYTDFPRRHDIWETDRINVDLYTNKKLGSGAFGAVYLGKLIGRSMAHKDANSILGVNLMRVENCMVAVKTLPEHADEASKEDFLREIALMKSIGFHERLVNMLACVTESEPYLLVVEYCSDGDLLQFLRYRCKYMIKLTELGIDYTEPKPEDDIDLTLVVTLKQLLMFAVQVSYGLEYLSQKGFVHRDIAARNILVNEGTACKIGDFGLCRQIGADEVNYKSRGGRLPLKWMSPEAIRNYEFSTKSDVWAFGILLFEIITLGGSPYPEMPADEVLPSLERGFRMEQPDNCSDEIYKIMTECWDGFPSRRPDFSVLRQQLAATLEQITEEYSYLKLDSRRDYYNVKYEEDGTVDVHDPPSKLATNTKQE